MCIKVALAKYASCLQLPTINNAIKLIELLRVSCLFRLSHRYVRPCRSLGEDLVAGELQADNLSADPSPLDKQPAYEPWQRQQPPHQSTAMRSRKQDLASMKQVRNLHTRAEQVEGPHAQGQEPDKHQPAANDRPAHSTKRREVPAGRAGGTNGSNSRKEEPSAGTSLPAQQVSFKCAVKALWSEQGYHEGAASTCGDSTSCSDSPKGTAVARGWTKRLSFIGQGQLAKLLRAVNQGHTTAKVGSPSVESGDRLSGAILPHSRMGVDRLAG